MRLWVLLLILFLAVSAYFLDQSPERGRKRFSPKPEASQEPDPQPPPLSPPIPESPGIDPATAQDQEISPYLEKITSLFKASDFRGALKLAQDLGHKFPDKPPLRQWLNKNLPALLLSSAWFEIRNNNCELAIEQLNLAETYGQHPQISFGLAHCHNSQGMVNLAEQEVVRSLQEQRTIPGPLLLYSEILESQGRFDEALELLEEATKLKAEGLDLEPKVEAMQKKARMSQDQQRYERSSFIISYPKTWTMNQVEDIENAINMAQTELETEFRFKKLDIVTEVIFYPLANFKNLMVGLPHWIGGVFDGRIRIPVDDSKPWEQTLPLLLSTLRHEFAHAAFRRTVGNRAIPIWLDEGFATWFACRQAGCGPFVFPAQVGAFMTTDQLLAPFIKLNRTEAEQAYRQSLYLLYLLIAQFGEARLPELIEPLDAQSSLSPDDLLAPFKLSFSALVEEAGMHWQARDRFD